MGWSWVGRWNLDDGEEQTELANGVGETLVIDRLGDVDVAAKFVEAFDLLGIVGRGEHHDRVSLQVLVLLDLPQDIDPRHFWQFPILYDYDVPALVCLAAAY